MRFLFFVSWISGFLLQGILHADVPKNRCQDEIDSMRRHFSELKLNISGSTLDLTGTELGDLTCTPEQKIEADALRTKYYELEDMIHGKCPHGDARDENPCESCRADLRETHQSFRECEKTLREKTLANEKNNASATVFFPIVENNLPVCEASTSSTLYSIAKIFGVAWSLTWLPRIHKLIFCLKKILKTFDDDDDLSSSDDDDSSSDDDDSSSSPPKTRKSPPLLYGGRRWSPEDDASDHDLSPPRVNPRLRDMLFPPRSFFGPSGSAFPTSSHVNERWLLQYQGDTTRQRNRRRTFQPIIDDEQQQQHQVVRHRPVPAVLTTPLPRGNSPSLRNQQPTLLLVADPEEERRRAETEQLEIERRRRRDEELTRETERRRLLEQERQHAEAVQRRLHEQERRRRLFEQEQQHAEAEQRRLREQQHAEAVQRRLREQQRAEADDVAARQRELARARNTNRDATTTTAATNLDRQPRHEERQPPQPDQYDQIMAWIRQAIQDELVARGYARAVVQPVFDFNLRTFLPGNVLFWLGVRRTGRMPLQRDRYFARNLDFLFQMPPQAGAAVLLERMAEMIYAQVLNNCPVPINAVEIRRRVAAVLAGEFFPFFEPVPVQHPNEWKK